jgi:23S rRNA pseudouridine1911/1915/1917 synthase
MFNHLKQQFKNRTIKKEYLVLAHGKIETDEGIINFPIVRSKNEERMAALPATPNGTLKQMNKSIKGGHNYEKSRDALTKFWTEKKYINFTLIRAKIHTGRTHQIRVHMLAYNHPVVGDNIYYQKKQNRKQDKKCGRLFLHSIKLGFKDLDNKDQEFAIKLPDELNTFLETIK